jgi:hypothetical protein
MATSTDDELSGAGRGVSGGLSLVGIAAVKSLMRAPVDVARARPGVPLPEGHEFEVWAVGTELR